MAAETSASSTTLPLQDRVAIVTGASRGIGKDVALHLASLGAKVVVNYASNPLLAQEVVSQINSDGKQIRAVAVQADVSDPAQVEALFKAAEETFQAEVHILVANAGFMDPKHLSIAETSVEDFDKMFNVNARGTFLCCREAAKRLKRGGGGRIITLSSSLAAAFRPGDAAYTASKAAIEAMTKILSKELKGTSITANCIAPGPVGTDLFFTGLSKEQIQGAANISSMGRLGEPRDVSPVVAFLAGDGSEWVNGQIIRVNGGFI